MSRWWVVLGVAALVVAGPSAARARPVVAVVAHNDGTEITDHLIPFGVLSAAGIAEVHAVAMRPGSVRLIPADLHVELPETVADFDARHPGGAAIVVVPAVHDDDDPALLDWVRAQAARGALVVGICDGAWVLARAGLLDGRSATAHWYSLDALAREFPRTRWVRDRRYVADDRVMTTTGVTAAIPASLALVERVGGSARAHDAATALGVPDWRPGHDSGAFRLTPRLVATAAANGLAFWRHERLALPIADGRGGARAGGGRDVAHVAIAGVPRHRRRGHHALRAAHPASRQRRAARGAAARGAGARARASAGARRHARRRAGALR